MTNTATSSDTSINIEALACWVFPLAATTMLFFQIYVPTSFGYINVNLADPIAILMGALFTVSYFGRARPRWRLPGVEASVLGGTLVIVLSYIHGFARFGWTDWAFSSKLVGWFVLLGYGATGALIVRAGGRTGLQIIVRTFVAVASGIVLFEYIIFTAKRLGLNIPDQVIQLPFQGFSQNRNAFGFLLLLGICCLPLVPARAQTRVLSVLLTGTWLAGSFANIGATIAVLGILLMTGHVLPRRIIISVLAATGAVCAVALEPWLVSLLSVQSHDRQTVWAIGDDGDSSRLARMKSLFEGLSLFWNHPLIGAGLGAYMQNQVKSGVPLVIHSTPIWLLAETGILGAGVLATGVIRWFVAGLRHMSDPVNSFLVLVILAFGIVCQVHEILYQRGFWLLLGVGLAYFDDERLVAE